MKYIIIFLVFFGLMHGYYSCKIKSKEKKYDVNMDEEIEIAFNVTDFTGNRVLIVRSSDEHVAVFKNDTTVLNMTLREGYYESDLTVKGLFLGRSTITFTLEGPDDISECGSIEVIVKRRKRVIDHVFTGSIIILVALIYINFGCALDWSNLKTILRRPIGPVIGFFGQFVVMPTLSYLVGLLVFYDQPEMRLGLLFTGVSPAGGASNVWTVILDGNIDLSVTMTTISTLAAFGMMPLWVFTVGPQIFADAKMEVPYEHIAPLVICLVIPLFIGWLIQRYLPRLSQILVRILKGFSALLIIFIVVFAIVTNLYLFQLLTYQVILAGLLLPWCGYLFGAAIAAIAKQPMRDIIAISVETGVQNTGIAIFLLRSLPQPQADLTTVVPVSVAIMTPIPLIIIYIIKRFFCKKKLKSKTQLEINSDDLTIIH